MLVRTGVCRWRRELRSTRGTTAATARGRKPCSSPRACQLTEYRAGDDPEKRREMIQRSHGGTTYPQIFINGRHVGGSDDIFDLDRAGQLDALLAETAAA